MPLALIALATALAANVILGPLVLAQIQWRVSANALNQTYGADAVSLVLVVPAALVAAALWRRRHPAAAPLALGVGLATLYYAVAETLGGDYLRYPGNNERFFLLFLALIVLGWTIAARAWTRIEPVRVSARFRRVVAVVLAVGAVPVALAWIAQLVAIAAGTDLGAAYEESPSAFWTIRIVDLGFIVPVALSTSVGLWRATPAAAKAALGVVTFLTMQAASVLAMGIVMIFRADPTATPGLVVVLAPVTVALAVVNVRLLLPSRGEPADEHRANGRTVATAHG